MFYYLNFSISRKISHGGSLFGFKNLQIFILADNTVFYCAEKSSEDCQDRQSGTCFAFHLQDLKEHFQQSEHDPEYDHNAFLGEDAKTFDQLSPEESKRRLG